MAPHKSDSSWTQAVDVPSGSAVLKGDLSVPVSARGVVLFAHGSGSGRQSTRNRFVASQLQRSGLATLLLDLLTAEEEATEQFTAHLRFDIDLLADRLVDATLWLAHEERTADLPVGYFGASTGGGAALVAATRCPERIAAVVSRGGRPDLAGEHLPEVRAPTLLIVGGNDGPVIDMNQSAFDQLGADEKQIIIVPGASHLFEEPGTLEQVARLAAEWFVLYLKGAVPASAV